MKYFRASISYDGRNFEGFQKQPKGRTIQGDIEKTLKKNSKSDIKILYAGRTDSNVHAIHNEIAFPLPINMNSDQVQKMLNSSLKKDIRINSVIECNKDFHPRFDAKKRTYLYVIYNDVILPPFYRGLVTHIYKKIDIKKLNFYLAKFEGHHDFKAYTTTKEKRDSRRTIYSSFAVKKDKFIYINISGKSFLYRQIRNIVGAALHLSWQESLNTEAIEKSFEKKKRIFSFNVAKPDGLYLKKIYY